jgi:cytochrome c-type biogenesis protein CcmH/NrfG
VLLAQAGVQATAQEPAEVETLFRQAEAFEEKGDYRQASELWERIVTIHKKVLGP